MGLTSLHLDSFGDLYVARIQNLYIAETQLIEMLADDSGGETCQAMKGLVKEGQETIDADTPASVRDAGLIAAVQRVEHYEITGYGTVRTFAEHLSRSNDARLLGETLAEEREADGLLNRIAEAIVDSDAAMA